MERPPTVLPLWSTESNNDTNSIQKMVLGQLGVHMQKNTPHTKIKTNLKWVEDLSLKMNTTEVLESRVNLHELGLRKIS